MKTIFKIILICAIGFNAYAQQVTTTSKQRLGKVEPYEITVTYDKTSHLIFPSAIRYVDLGSEYLIAGKAEDAENVLRVKATIKDFEAETNFSVVTNDGRFYNFNVGYSSSPEALSFDLLNMGSKTNTNEVLFQELGNNSPSVTAAVSEEIYTRDKRRFRHIDSKSSGIRFILKGIYIKNDKYYFHTEVKNSTNVPFRVDFITFKIVDKKRAKRTAIQEKTLLPLRSYKPLNEIKGKASQQNVFLLDLFTLAGDKVLKIDIFEKSGGRQQSLRIKNSDLIKAFLTEDGE